MTDRQDSLDADLNAARAWIRFETPNLQKLRELIGAEDYLPLRDRLLVTKLVAQLKHHRGYETLFSTSRIGLLLPQVAVSGTRVVTPPPPYPADLVQAPQASPIKATQWLVLVKVLVWLVAVIVPIVQQRLGAEAQVVTDTEVGTLSFALAINVLLDQGKK